MELVEKAVPLLYGLPAFHEIYKEGSIDQRFPHHGLWVLAMSCVRDPVRPRDRTELVCLSCHDAARKFVDEQQSVRA